MTLSKPVIFLRYCIFLVLFISFSQGSAQPMAKPYTNSRFMEVDSVQIHYRIWNDDLEHPKGSVVFVHGFTGSTFCWRKNVDTLVQQGYRVVAFDLPSFGYSERKPELNQSQSNRARLTWKLLEQIDGTDTVRWHVVGHSMGGGIAEAMALMEPGRTKSLTIVAGMVFTKNQNMTGAFVVTAQNKQFRKIYSDILEDNFLTYNRMRKSLKSAYQREPDSSEVMGYLTPLQIEGTAEAILGVWANAKEVEKFSSDSLKNTSVLLIWGTKDRWIPKSSAKSFIKSVPSARVDLITGAGHIPMETHSYIFNSLLVDFLNSHYQ